MMFKHLVTWWLQFGYLKNVLDNKVGSACLPTCTFSNWALTTGNGFVYDKLRFPDTANNHCEETRTAN